MFSIGNIISSIVCSLWAFFGGYLLWEIIADPILLAHLNTNNSIHNMPDFITLSIGCLITGFAFSTMYSKWARGIHHAKHGAEFGIWLGVLLGLGNGIIDHATKNLLNLTGTLINGFVYCVFFVVMGILSSFVLGKIAK